MTPSKILIAGASGNIGRACMEFFPAQGREVIGVSRKGPSIYHVDLAAPTQVSELVARLPPFDLVVMAHGTQQPHELEAPNFIDTYWSIIRDNLHSAVYLTHFLLSQNKLNEGALIVYCSSIHAMQPRQGRAPYAIAKAGLEALARSAAIEGAALGIRAIALRLGQMDKAMKGISFTPEQFREITDKLLTAPVTCEEVAKFILTLYDMKGMNGVVFDYNSGHHLSIWP